MVGVRIVFRLGVAKEVNIFSGDDESPGFILFLRSSVTF
jgi:hypothetical protein